MATTTTNLGLTKPDYTDAADIAVINTNMDTVDTAITATKSDLGIVEDGNTATHSITAGQYVIWKGNLYTASSAIAIGTTLSTSNLTAVSNGGLNSLNSKIDNQIKFTDLTFQSTTDITAGTIGTRGQQLTATLTNIPTGYTVLAVFPSYVQNSNSYIPFTFMQNNVIYLNYYRATNSAISKSDTLVHVRVVYGKAVWIP